MCIRDRSMLICRDYVESTPEMDLFDMGLASKAEGSDKFWITEPFVWDAMSEYFASHVDADVRSAFAKVDAMFTRVAAGLVE